MATLAEFWEHAQQFALWATQGRRLFVTLAILAVAFSWIGMMARGGATLRGYVTMALISPFLVLAGMFVGLGIEWLFDAFDARQAPIRRPLTFLTFPLVAFVIGYRSGTWQGGPALKRGAQINGAGDLLAATRSRGGLFVGEWLGLMYAERGCEVPVPCWWSRVDKRGRAGILTAPTRYALDPFISAASPYVAIRPAGGIGPIVVGCGGPRCGP